MSKKKDTWNQIKRHLESKLTKSEFKTWFQETTLKRFDPELAIIEVPNKFVANWLMDKYLREIKKSFRKVAKQSPSVHFSYDHPPTPEQRSDSHFVHHSEFYLTHRLNPSMTFERFVAGECNTFACCSALEVANTPTKEYNPLYIYCGPGLGKTHLLNAIGNHRLRKDPECRIRYLSSDTFSSDFAYAIKNEKVDEFREEYCSLDLLLFDDVQLLAHREKTQEQFLFIFNSLYSAKKQVVVTADSPPNKLRNINPQLRSRLGSGVLAEVKPPNQNTKIDILKKRSKEDNIPVPDDVIFFLANAEIDVKSLIKNIVRLESHASLSNADISISMLKSLIKNKEKTDIGMDDIKTTTAAYFNISMNDLSSKKKKRIYSYPRQLAMYLARKHTHLSLQEIGDAFGHKDHSTVIYALRRIEKQKDKEKVILNDIHRIESLLG